MLPPCRVEAVERRLAAIHEAGHITAAIYLGLLNVSGAIWKCGEASASSFNKSWVGDTSFRPIRIKDGRAFNLRAPDLTLMAVAGSVSELCWHGVGFLETVENESWHDPSAMSDSDWRAAKCAPGYPTPSFIRAIEKAFRLFSRSSGILWPQVAATARTLVVQSRSAGAAQ